MSKHSEITANQPYQEYFANQRRLDLRRDAALNAQRAIEGVNSDLISAARWGDEDGYHLRRAREGLIKALAAIRAAEGGL